MDMMNQLSFERGWLALVPLEEMGEADHPDGAVVMGLSSLSSDAAGWPIRKQAERRVSETPPMTAVGAEPPGWQPFGMAG
jgi:hypothetical protein